MTAWLPPEAAAHYLGLTLGAFIRRVKSSILPGASYHLGQRSPRWQVAALDAIMIGTAQTHTQEVANAAAEILAEGRARRAAHAGRRNTGRVSIPTLGRAENKRTISG